MATAGLGEMIHSCKLLGNSCKSPGNFVFVSTIGAISVIKAVYIEKRDLNCACVGGGSEVPLGFISLTENLMMMVMLIWMLVKMI